MSCRGRKERPVTHELHHPSTYAEMMVDWHEDLARVGIEQAPDFTLFRAKSPSGVLQRMLKLGEVPLEFCSEVPSCLWQSNQFKTNRDKLIKVHDMADAFYRGIPHHKPQRTYVEGTDQYKRENPNTHASRASYFALRYLGVVDPVIHALIRLGGIQNDEGINNGKDDLTYTRCVTKSRALQEMVADGELPSDFVELLLTLKEDSARCNRATAEVTKNEKIPEGSRLGDVHTAESFWKLYQNVTQHHTSNDHKAPSSFRGTMTLYRHSRYPDGGVPLGEYRKFVARIALIYEKFMHRDKDLDALEIQKRALPILMELWPVARGLNEGIFGRYVGEAIASAFMPEEYRNLGDTVNTLFPGDALINEKEQYAQWYLQFLKTVLPDATFVSAYDILRNEYRELRGQDVRYKRSDVSVPSVTSDRKPSKVNVIDTKTRSSVFWKMLEIWNDRGPEGKYHKLPDDVKRMTWGSPQFWEWIITHHHDIFRTQLLLLGDQYDQASSEAIADVLKEIVKGENNRAECMFPAFWESEIFEPKSIGGHGEGAWYNAIIRPKNHSVNLEIQLRDRAAHSVMAVNTGPRHHAVYKLRHLIDWSQQAKILPADEDQVKAHIADGARQLRRAHLAATHGFENGDARTYDTTSRNGTIYRR